ncbi:plastocyanin/azurin family copper-binding protein [Maribacter thermophilus]|uniref:plastocyanin/azurin family copper-binding protein n=1 Tax=Maribacter thermophilus TaxID=1197874 RepID=UPI000640EC0C|nr:plastocyanin/azurin family copper-binding protein [Maribacter thermophilus]
MKRLVIIMVLVIGAIFSANAQDKTMKGSTEVIALEQVPGEFTQKQITVSEGTYIFEISNNNVGHNVGFVLVKKGQDISKPENHIKTAYVKKQVETGKTESSKPTVLEKGEYVYFCPLNPTATDNTLTVK